MSPTNVTDIRAFLPAEDFALSRQFYLDLGFQETWNGGDACGLAIAGHGFTLTSHYTQEYAGNCMMSLFVDDADPWWAHITALDLHAKYSLHTCKPPALQPWGLRVLYISDPAGVLWHIAGRRTG